MMNKKKAKKKNRHYYEIQFRVHIEKKKRYGQTRRGQSENLLLNVEETESSKKETTGVGMRK